MYKRGNQGWLKHIDFIIWDVVALQAAYILGYKIRHGWDYWPYLSANYNSLALVLLVVDILVCILFSTMHNVIKRGSLEEFAASVKHAVLVLAIMSLYLFSTQIGDVYSRITIYLTAGFHLIIGFLIRVLWKKFIRRYNRNKGKAAMILVADESAVERIVSTATEMDGFRYVGVILSNRDAEGETVQGLKVVANLDNAADYICRERVDEVFICPESQGGGKSALFDAVDGSVEDNASIPEKSVGKLGQGREARLIEQCREMALPVHISLPASYTGGKNLIEKVGGHNVLTLTANYASAWSLALKRAIDILGGLVGSILALIIIAIIGPKIRKESPGPILFKQTRIGLNGKRFKFYKIRSMYLDAEDRKKELMAQNRVSDGMMFKLDFDPRIIGNKIVDGKQVTGIGEKIRSSSLDEFPQFFNVLRGDMSLVGTRPPTEDEWEKYQYHHRARLAIKPGLTGMWQVSGRSEITDFEEVVKLDTEYINNWSLGLDAKILWKTIGAVLMHKGAM